MKFKKGDKVIFQADWRDHTAIATGIVEKTIRHGFIVRAYYRGVEMNYSIPTQNLRLATELECQVFEGVT